MTLSHSSNVLHNINMSNSVSLSEISSLDLCWLEESLHSLTEGIDNNAYYMYLACALHRTSMTFVWLFSFPTQQLLMLGRGCGYQCRISSCVYYAKQHNPCNDLLEQFSHGIASPLSHRFTPCLHWGLWFWKGAVVRAYSNEFP